jgi:dTDP-4-dehydrorhamnose reductase
MKVGIIGGSGMLGTELMKVFPGAYNLRPPHGIENAPQLASYLDHYDIVINTAALLMDTCESNPNRAFEVNYIGAHNLAMLCRYRGMRLIHISTNYVFNGRKWTGYTPSDFPDPLSVYGYSKWMGECAIRDEIERGLSATIVRLGMIYGHAPCRGKVGGRQFVSDLLHKTTPLTYYIDQRMNPINTADAADAISRIVSSYNLPVMHVGSANECSYYEFAREILHLAGDKRWVEPILSPINSKRPLNGVLIPSVSTPTWQESLRRYFISRPEGA